MKTSIITITILFIVMAAGHAYGQAQGGGCPFPLECKPTDGGHNPTPGKGVKIGKLIFKAIGKHDSDGQDEMAPATKKRPKAGKLAATQGVLTSDQCRVRDGGCIRPTFPPKKPKLPTGTAYFAAVQSDLTAMALQTGDQGAKKKKETKKETKPKTDKLNIPIFED